MKTVACVLVGNQGERGDVREVTLERGSTASDLVRALGLPENGYTVGRDNSAMTFAGEEDIYSQVDEGQKLRIAPLGIVGSMGM